MRWRSYCARSSSRSSCSALLPHRAVGKRHDQLFQGGRPMDHVDILVAQLPGIIQIPPGDRQILLVDGVSQSAPALSRSGAFQSLLGVQLQAPIQRVTP